MIWKPHVTVAAVIERDGKFLLVEEKADGAVVFNQPAGHLEEGEGLIQAVMRETLEETGWPFSPQALLGAYLWRNPRTQITYLRFAFIGAVESQAPQRPLDNGILRAVWMTLEEIRQAAPRHRSPQVQRCIDDFLSGRHFPLSFINELREEIAL